jgi:acyl-CoA thioesterase I
MPGVGHLLRIILLGTALSCPRGLDAATIVCLGDSITAGLGLSEEEAYPALVQGLARQDGRDWRLVNAGVSGDTTAGGLRRIDWLVKGSPDLVLVALGANDGLRGLPVAVSKANLLAIVERLRAAKVRVALAGMYLPMNYGEDYRTAFAALFPAVATEDHLPLLPFLLEGVGGKAELNQADGIHPTAAGQRLIATHVYAFLKSALAYGGPP